MTENLQNNNTPNRARIDELVGILNHASKVYYSGADEEMSNYEWDALFDELKALEEETGYIREDSPTITTGSEESEGNREPHEFPALSLAKTKKIPELQKWAGDYDLWLSWKLDGLTLVLTYDNGELTKILTRGNGVTGNNITYLKDAIGGIPSFISYKGHLVVRGEAAISYSDFEEINALIEDDDEKYANPRNLASGTLSLDNPEKVKERHVNLYAFTLVYLDEDIISWGERMEFLKKQGFCTVDYEACNSQSLPEVIQRWTARVEDGSMDIPVDGLVITYDDTVYAASGSVTGHHATRAGLAFKWEDVSAFTKLKYVEWSCAASTISPVAVFEPVLLEGTTVSRASLCNISEMERLGIGESCTLEVIKANKIIPKCISVKDSSGDFRIPDKCPVCGAQTTVNISINSHTKTLRCTNEYCTAKHAKKYTRFVSKLGFDIDGLSIQTMLRFMNVGFIKDFADIFNLSSYKDEIIVMEGFGEKSFDNMDKAIEKARNVDAVHFIYALCIPMIGNDAAKKIIASVGFDGFLGRLESGEGFEDIVGIGPERSKACLTWYGNPVYASGLKKLLSVVTIVNGAAKSVEGGTCTGKTFVITGEVHRFKNRDEFKAYVESQGGKVAGSVSGKTDYLVNNDVNSGSSKNQKARELKVPILSEEDFMNQFGSPF